jgi:hypothetical protein
MPRKKGRKRSKRPLNRRLSILDRGIAMGMSKVGIIDEEIANDLNCAPKSIRELKKKVEIHQTLEDLPRKGRPKKTSPREDRTIKFNSLNNRKLTAKAMAIKQCQLL